MTGGIEIRRTVEAARAAHGAAETPPDDPALDRELGRLPMNDLGNAERFRRRFGRDVLYVRDIGWHVWVGTHWDQETGEAAVQRMAHRTAELIVSEIDALEPELGESVSDVNALKDALWKWARASGNAPRIRGMLEVVAPKLTRLRSELDADPWLFNVRNGTIVFTPPGVAIIEDVDPVALRKHNRDDLITRIAPVTFNADASAPEWAKFMSTVQPDDGLQGYLQRHAGYTLTGDVSAQQFDVFFGEGANGKSTYLNVLRGIMGRYAQTVPVGLFLEDDRLDASQASPETARLVGVRLALASEPNKKRRLDPARIKALTGGEPIVTRALYGAFFELIPQFKPVLSFNERPAVPAADDGTWRRLRIVPWPVQIPPEKRIPRFEEELLKEASGILNWMLDGFRMWREMGMVPPIEVKAATDDYRSDSDSVGEFLRAATKHDRDAPGVAAGAIRKAYEKWCEANAIEPIGARRFGEGLKKKLKSRKSGVVVYEGIRLVENYAGYQDLRPSEPS